MALDTVTGSHAAQLLAGKPLCVACALHERNTPAGQRETPINALVVDAKDTVHAGDVVTGQTACGRDLGLGTWIITSRQDPRDHELPT